MVKNSFGRINYYIKITVDLVIFARFSFSQGQIREFKNLVKLRFRYGMLANP